MPVKKTKEMYMQQLEEFKIPLILTGEYIGNYLPVEHTCAYCGNKMMKKPSLVISNKLKGISYCNKCSDGISFPNKFVSNVLEELNIDFEREYKIGKIRRYYDIYISPNIIIENNGLQHYKHTHFHDLSNTTISDSVQNDNFKKEHALNNGITYYIELDCSKSTLEHIKNSIMNSALPNILNFSEDDVNWDKCLEKSLGSAVIKCCDMWNTNKYSVNQLAKIMKTSHVTISNYLKYCAECGLCDYNPEEEIKKSYDKMHESSSKKVKLINTGEVFTSLREAFDKYGIQSNTICACCNGSRLYAGKINGKKAVWEYCDESILDEIREKITKYGEIRDISICENLDMDCNYCMTLYNDGLSGKEIYDTVYTIWDRGKVSRCLNKCAKLGLCSYDGSKEKNRNRQRKVICITTNKIFDSIKDAEKYYNITNIYANLSGHQTYTGIYKAQKLIWEFYEDVS